MDLAGVFDEGDEAVLSMFQAGMYCAFAICAASQRDAWWALIFTGLCAVSIWLALG